MYILILMHAQHVHTYILAASFTFIIKLKSFSYSYFLKCLFCSNILFELFYLHINFRSFRIHCSHFILPQCIYAHSKGHQHFWVELSSFEFLVFGLIKRKQDIKLRLDSEVSVFAVSLLKSPLIIKDKGIHCLTSNKQNKIHILLALILLCNNTTADSCICSS